MRKWGLLLLVCALGLSACKFAGGEGPFEEPEENILIYASLSPMTTQVQGYIDRFNKNHEDVKIEVRDYSDEDGPQRLLVELMAGIIPDIVEMKETETSQGKKNFRWHLQDENLFPLQNNEARNISLDSVWMPYRQLVQKGYLENLWPYIENDPDLGRGGVVEPPLKAAEVNGGLYMIFGEFYINTLTGNRQVVGDRCGWTFDEMMDAFSVMPSDSSILAYNTTQKEVFFTLLCHTLDQYVDWNTGETFFDSDTFRDFLEFLNTFPAEFDTYLSQEEVLDEAVWRIMKGRQMLAARSLCRLQDICYIDSFFGDRCSFVGYPTSGGDSGSIFVPYGPTFAMTTSCRNKEAAWEFMRQVIGIRYNYSKMKEARQMWDILTPVNCAQYEMGNRIDLQDAANYMIPWNWTYEWDGPWMSVSHEPDLNDLERYETLINKTTQFYWPDDGLSNIVWESIGPYLAGDKTMDETIRLLDNRVTLYVNELR